MAVHREGKLLDIVRAGCPPCRFTGRLHRRKEQADKCADDGDDDEKFDEGEPGLGPLAGPGLRLIMGFFAKHGLFFGITGRKGMLV
jgi:hypothetical protein